MKSELAKCNTFYWSKRYAEKCYCVGVASFLVDLQFEDISKNGWIKASLIDNAHSVISSVQISKTSTDTNLFDRQVIDEDTVRIEFEFNAAKLYSFAFSSE